MLTGSSNLNLRGFLEASETRPEGISARCLRQLAHLAEACEDQAEKRKFWLLGGLFALYLLATCGLAAQKPLWHDELSTYYIALLPKISDIWSVLLSGGDLTPPLLHVVTRASFALFGVNHVSARLPEVLSFWLMSLCLFQFTSKRSSALYGFAAMLFPLVTGAYAYAAEARPYALVLGFGGLSLLCWQAAAEGHARVRSLLGLAVSLAAAVSSHYYGFLLVGPLAVGEGVRARARRRLDWPMYIALGSAMTLLLLFLPLIRQARSFSPTFWAHPAWTAIPKFYNELLELAVLPLVPVLLIAAIYPMISPRTPHRITRGSPPPRYEMAAALAYTVLPVVTVILAKLVTGAFTNRYALPAVIGFSILIAFGAYRLANGRALIGAVLVFLLCALFAVTAVKDYRDKIVIVRAQANTYKFLQAKSMDELPIVVSDALTFVELAHYAPGDLAARLVYLADPRAALRYFRHDTPDRAILIMRPWFPFKIEEYSPYIASQRQFLVYGNLRSLDWLLTELLAAEVWIQLRGHSGDHLLFLVSPKGEPKLSG